MFPKFPIQKNSSSILIFNLAEKQTETNSGDFSHYSDFIFSDSIVF
jgi:hypothetical protein